MFNRLAAGLAVSVFCFAGFAKAAGVVPATDYDWSGMYVGLTAGQGSGDYLQQSILGAGVKVDIDGITFGGTAGYNNQISRNVVLGLEADLSTGIDGITPRGTVGIAHACATGDCNVDIQFFGTGRVRAGLAADRMLLYATGGLAIAQYDGGIYNAVHQGSTETNLGWTAGAGAELGVTENLSLKVEYLHIDVGTLDFGMTGGGANFVGKGDFDVIRFGMNWRF